MNTYAYLLVDKKIAPVTTRGGEPLSTGAVRSPLGPKHIELGEDDNP